APQPRPAHPPRGPRAPTGAPPLTRRQPPPLILLPCHRIRLAVEHPRSDLPAIRFDAHPVADLAFRRDLPLDTHRAGASLFASSQAGRASSSQSTLRPTLIAEHTAFPAVANGPSTRSRVMTGRPPQSSYRSAVAGVAAAPLGTFL